MKLKRILATIICLAMVLGSMSLTAFAEEVKISEDITGTEENPSALSITEDTTIVIDGNVTLKGAKGGAGIYVAEDVTLTITGTGKLIAIGNNGDDDNGSGAAGIGGTMQNPNCGNIIIDGVTVEAYGYGKHSAGIGSGYSGIPGEITIRNEATVKAQGAFYSEGGIITTSWGSGDPEGGAGIGGGSNRHDTIIGDITITDSTVVAYGGSKGAGIGAGYHSGCGTIRIEGSTVTATGGTSSAGIGTSRTCRDKGHERASAADIEIIDSKVTAIGGDCGAGIGTGFDTKKKGYGKTTIFISESEIDAKGGKGASGIGGGFANNNIEVEIESSKVKAKAGEAMPYDLLGYFPDAKDRTGSDIGGGADEGNEKLEAPEDAVSVEESYINNYYAIDNDKIIMGSFNSGISGVKITDPDDPERYRERFGVELNTIKAYESLEVLYYAENGDLIATTSLRQSDRDDENVTFFPVNGGMTVNTVVAGRLAGSWDTEWHEVPTVGKLPATLELWIDGKLFDTRKAFSSDSIKADYIALPGVKAVAEIEGLKFGSLQDAANEAEEGDVITLLDDNYIDSTVDIRTDLTIDLAGYKIAPSDNFVRANGNDSVIAVFRGAELTVEDSVGDGVIDGSEVVYAAVKLTELGDAATGDAAEFVLNGGTLLGSFYGIVGNGSRDNTVITINGGKIQSFDEVSNAAIYHPQDGVIYANGGVLEGYSAVYLAAGSLVVPETSTTEFIGNGSKVEYNPMISGFQTTGAAVVIDNRNDGVGGYGEVSAEIKGGYFKSLNADAVESVAKEGLTAINGFITNGHFTSDVSAYAAEGLEAVYGGESEYPYTIADKKAGKINLVLVPTEEDEEFLIKLKTADEYEINEFVAAELTFENLSTTVGGSTLKYEISGNDEVGTIAQQAADDDREAQYIIKLKDGAKRLSGEDITIGKVTFLGQGTIDFKAVNGIVTTTWQGTHLGRYYKAEDATLDLLDSDLDDAIYEVKKDVIVKVAYNHQLVGGYWNDDMITVTIKDGFGNVYEPCDISDGVEEFKDVKLGRLTVTIEAPGFRKYVYNTTLEAEENGEAPLVLNFWNEVKRDTVQSPLAEIESGKSGLEAHNFLVGDIVMDYKVDEYDLAAVTSYYGSYDIDKAEAEKYIKYDLNRDGNIDIIDVQYVLHTLDN